jgi:two-component system phosphate regulon sensor histidine kinase PhoR
MEGIAMDRPKWFLHPIAIFVLSIVALAMSLFLYIHWYVQASVGLHTIIKRFNLEPGQVLSADTWVVIMVLTMLVGVILLGIFSIFVYNLKTLQLYRLQNNFINNFTHELKTPVTSLKLFLQTFSRHELSRGDQLKYIQYMIADVDRLMDNIDRILNLARIESKRFVGEFVTSDVEQTVRRFFDNNIHLFQQGRIEIQGSRAAVFQRPVNLPLFEMLLINLATNAFKYNHSQEPLVTVIFESNGRKGRIHFKDNGIGFEKREIKKIFRKFYQIGRSDNMTAKGSGLGLYLVQQIARIHKWKVSASSEGNGKGSIFTLSLPPVKLQVP